MTDFFKHGNKVYSENLNDGILVGNSFDWTVNMSLPGDTGGVFPNTTTVVKAKVADVSATPNSNLSIGETITNNAGSSQVYRLTVYPNFNRFGGFTFVSLEGDGDVIITEVGASAPIRNNLDYSNLGDVVELKQLKEYDIVVTIPAGGVVTGLGFGFQSSAASAEASISQANVTGLEDELSSLQTEVLPTLITPASTISLKNNQLYYSKKGNICMVDGTYELNSRGGIHGLRVGFLPNSFKPVRPVKNVLYWGDGYTVRCSIIIEDGKPLLYFETEGNRIIPQETVLYVHIVWLCESESV